MQTVRSRVQKFRLLFPQARSGHWRGKEGIPESRKIVETGCDVRAPHASRPRLTNATRVVFLPPLASIHSGPTSVLEPRDWDDEFSIGPPCFSVSLVRFFPQSRYQTSIYTGRFEIVLVAGLSRSTIFFLQVPLHLLDYCITLNHFDDNDIPSQPHLNLAIYHKLNPITLKCSTLPERPSPFVVSKAFARRSKLPVFLSPTPKNIETNPAHSICSFPQSQFSWNLVRSPFGQASHLPCSETYQGRRIERDDQPDFFLERCFCKQARWILRHGQVI